MSTVAVLSAGLGNPSSTRLLADRIAEDLQREGHQTTSVELRPLAHAITDMMLTGFPSEELQAAFDTVEDSAGLVAVTPAFNASYSGLFKSFFDVLPEDSLADMPVLIAATGGTERHSLVLEHAMRPMFSYLHALVSPTGVYAATDDFGDRVAVGSLQRRIDRATGEFSRLLGACGSRERHDEWDQSLATMEGLLGGPRPGASPGAVSVED